MISKVSLDDKGFLKQEDTLVTKTTADEEDDYFIFHEKRSGTVVLGTKYSITRLFASSTILCDGTFKSSPYGFSQIYIVWYLVEDLVEGETVKRCKAFPGLFIFMKSKSTREYDDAFKIIER